MAIMSTSSSEAEAGFLETSAHHPVEQSDGWEVLHPRETHRFDLRQKLRHQYEKIRSIDTGQHRCPLDDGKNLARHLPNDFIGVAEREKAGCQPRPAMR